MGWSSQWDGETEMGVYEMWEDDNISKEKSKEEGKLKGSVCVRVGDDTELGGRAAF